MTIFVNENTKVIVQGMTGSEGTKHTKRMLKAGTKIVAGVTPGKGGQSVDMDGQIIPVFNSVKEAITATGANASVVFVPPKFAKSAVIDAIDAKIPLVVVITEGIPVHDVAAFYAYSVEKGVTQILGSKATKPIVVRLDGNNVELGRKILSEANHPLIQQIETMDGAAAKAAELAANK